MLRAVVDDRRRLLHMSLSGYALAADVNLSDFAAQLDGYSGSDIQCVCM